MAINDLLPLKADRRDAIAIVFRRPRDTSDLMSMVSVTFTMQHHLMRLASAPFTSFRLAKFEFHLLSTDLRVTPDRLTINQIAEFTEGGKKLGPILTRLRTKVHKILRECRIPLVVSNAFVRLSIS